MGYFVAGLMVGAAFGFLVAAVLTMDSRIPQYNGMYIQEEPYEEDY